MPRPRKLSDEQRNRLLIIALWRRKAPSNKQLAFEMGVSQRTIEAVMTTLLRQSRESAEPLSDKIAV